MKDQHNLFAEPPPQILKGIFIPGNVPALKNNKKIIQIPIKGSFPCKACGKRKGRPMLISSDRHKEYVKDTQTFYTLHRQTFLNAAKDKPKPLRVAFQFIRKSRHAFDYTNSLDTIQDLLTANGWIPDDNADELIPVLCPYIYDKLKPGVVIAVL